ncbi:MAG: TonB-dependent receptor [Desulfobacteraceae bacterium]|nr:TonB-dependent receptor [Desulfobacteraceae bacterium]
MIQCLFSKTRLIAVFIILLPVLISAEESNEIFYLPEVVVTESDQMKNTGNSEYKEDLIEKIPVSNSSVTEILKLKPSVRFSNEENSPLTSGEILPEEISISGGKFYDNSFTLDGSSIGSFLDPVSSDPRSITDVPGYSTMIFTDPFLLKSIKIYENDIPAKYGGFTGGVIACETKKPSDKFKGRLKFITTRSEWTSFNFKGNLKNEFKSSTSERMQPDFEKYDSSLMLEGPISDNTGYIFSFRNNYSKIPLYHLGTTKNQERELNSVFIKLDNENSAGNSSSLNLSYTPYKANYFMPNAKDSDYSINSGGLNLTGKTSFQTINSDLDLTIGYSRSDYDRDANQNWYLWKAFKSKDFGLLAGKDTSSEGGFGDIKKNEQSLNLNTHVEWYKKNIYKNLFHRPSAGFFYTFAMGEETRDKTTYSYSSAVADNPDFIAPLNDPASVPGEQYLSKRLEYFPYSGKENLNLYGIYLEELFFINRFSLRTGLRVSKDDFLENTNISPRLTFTYDILKNRNLSFHSGYNRYYSHGFLQHKLKEARKTSYKIQWRSTFENHLTQWMEDSDSPTRLYKYSDLETPYADEYSTGIKARAFKTDFHLKYIKKYFRDEFAMGYGYREEGRTIYEYNNSGRSEYECVSFTAEKTKENDYSLILNISWQDRVSTIESYNSDSDEETQSELVYYKNKLMFRDEMPASDYNQPLTANLLIYKKMFDNLHLSFLIKYVKDYNIISNTGEFKEIVSSDEINPVTGEPYKEEIPIYENKKRDSVLSCDLKSEIPFLIHKRYKAGVLFSVLNIFNNTNTPSSTDVIPTPGRQFYAGFKFDF